MPEIDMQPELLSIRKKLADSIEEDTKQIGILTTRMNKNKELLHAINGSLGAIVSVATGYGATLDLVRATVKSMDASKFTPPDVERVILLNTPTAEISKDTIRTALWTMQRKGEIKQLRKGNNREPAEYEKIMRFKQVSEEGMDKRRKNAIADYA